MVYKILLEVTYKLNVNKAFGLKDLWSQLEKKQKSTLSTKNYNSISVTDSFSRDYYFSLFVFFCKLFNNKCGNITRNNIHGIVMAGKFPMLKLYL